MGTYVCTLNNTSGRVSEQSSITVTEKPYFTMQPENISAFDMDSLLIDYSVYDQDYNKSPINYPRQDSLKAGAVLIDTLTFSSTPYQDNNNLWITANPIDYNINQQDQPEQY